jgi:ABC-2 type transport system permease protein
MILAAFALAIGALLRSTAAGITALLIEMLVQPIAVLLPGPAGKAAEYLPSAAGGRILNIAEAARVPKAYQGQLIVALWAAALFALAGFRLRSQDA